MKAIGETMLFSKERAREKEREGRSFLGKKFLLSSNRGEGKETIWGSMAGRWHQPVQTDDLSGQTCEYTHPPITHWPDTWKIFWHNANISSFIKTANRGSCNNDMWGTIESLREVTIWKGGDVDIVTVQKRSANTVTWHYDPSLGEKW